MHCVVRWTLVTLFVYFLHQPYLLGFYLKTFLLLCELKLVGGTLLFYVREARLLKRYSLHILILVIQLIVVVQ